MERITLVLYFLVACLSFSLGNPVHRADRLEVKFTEGIEITSPGYENGHYPDRTEKLWELYAPHAKKIEVVFEDFDIEFHHNCIWDSVTLVRAKCDYFTASQQGDVVLCGPLSAYTFDSDSSPICIMFVSDMVVNKRGFKAHAIAIPDVKENTTSGGSNNASDLVDYNSTKSTTLEILSQKSSLTSSMPYTTSSKPSQFTSQISSFSSSLPSSSPPSPSPSSSPSMSSSSSSLSSFSSSTSSKLSTTTSSSSEAPSTTSSSSSVSATLSLSSSLPSSKSKTSSLSSSITTTASATISPLPLLLSSQSSVISSLFPFTTSVQNGLSSLSSSTLHETTELPDTSTLSMNIDICDHHHQSIDIGSVNELVVMSPNDDSGRYPRNKHCVLTINNHKLQDITIEFIHFEVESHPVCGYDFLELKLGDETHRLCGKTSPDSFKTQTELIQLVFHSDEFIILKGFEIKFTKESQLTTRDSTSINETLSITSPTEVSTNVDEAASTFTTDVDSTYEQTVDYTVTVDDGSLIATTTAEGTDSSTSVAMSSASTVSTQSPGTSKLFLATTKSPFSNTPMPSPSNKFTATVLTSIFSKIHSAIATSTSAKTGNTFNATSNSKTTNTVKLGTDQTSKSAPSESSSSQSLPEVTFSSQSMPSELFSNTTTLSSTPESSTKLETTTSVSEPVTSAATTSSWSPTVTSETESPSAMTQPLNLTICNPVERTISMVDKQELRVHTPKDDSGKYPVNKHCVLFIENQQQEDINIDFIHFELEYHSLCTWDYILLTFLGGDSHRLCGKLLPNSLTTNARRIEIIFHSDHIVPSDGFEIKLSKQPNHEQTSSRPFTTSNKDFETTLSLSHTVSHNPSTVGQSSTDLTKTLETHPSSVLPDSSSMTTIKKSTTVFSTASGTSSSSTVAMLNTASTVKEKATAFGTQPSSVMSASKESTTVSLTTSTASSTSTLAISDLFSTSGDSFTDSSSTPGSHVTSNLSHSSGASKESSAGLTKTSGKPFTPDVSSSSPLSTAESERFATVASDSQFEGNVLQTPEKHGSTKITDTKNNTPSHQPENSTPKTGSSSSTKIYGTQSKMKPTSENTQLTYEKTADLTTATENVESTHKQNVLTTETNPSDSVEKEIYFDVTTAEQSSTQTDNNLPATSINQTNILPTTNALSTSSSSLAETTGLTGAGPLTTGSTISPGNACSVGMMPAVIDKDFGYISSPGYSGSDQYPPASTCQWLIEKEENKVTMIIFKDFDVESSPGCQFDNLKIYETSNNGETKTLLGRFCGDAIPSTLTSYKDLLVEFKSDTEQQATGFRFKFIKAQSNSSLSYKCPHGKIPCSTSGVCIPVEWWCDNSVDCEDLTDEKYCPKCPDDQLQCGDGVCLSKSNRCDGIPQCSYGTDEHGCVSVTQENHENSVQINVEGSWFPLCHDDVTVIRKDHICKAAGYRSSEMLTGEKIKDERLFSVATLESGLLAFNKSSTCKGKKVVHLQCSDSECGRKGEHLRKKRIIGGSISSKGEWPWSVAVRAGKSTMCGGSIINSMWIVTAGHCVKDLVNNPQILSIVAGVNDINDADGQMRYISEVIVHPNYKYIFNADIALLRLQQPLKFDNNVRAICLPWDRRQFSPSDLCYVTGFGVSDMKAYYTTVTPKYLRHIKTKIFDLDKCQDIYSTKYSTVERVKDNMLCAGYTSSGMDACKGDSGGGLMCKTADDRWLLAGVVSWGDLCGNTNKPGVYTNVVSFMDWIENTTDPNVVEDVTCNFETNGWCGYTDTSPGNYVWTRKPGDKYVKGSILYATKTSWVIDNKPVNASIVTPVFSTIEEGCLSFSFMFSSNSNITLSVYGLLDSDAQEPTSELLWRVISHYPAKDTWKSTEFTFSNSYNRFKFVSLSEHGGIIGLGLDNISLATGHCVGLKLLSCTFNDGNICNYEQSSGYDYKEWTIAPEQTLAAMAGNHELYLKAGGNFETFGYRAMSQFISPALSHGFTSLPHCVTFSFNKNSPTKNDLVLATYVTIGEQLTNQNIYWSSADDNIEQWSSVSVTIQHGIYDHIVFEVQRKEYTYENIEIFIDNIFVADGLCVN